MTAFLHDDFLLSGDNARALFHGHAKNMPIADYHCHINPADIAANRSFDNIAQLWLAGDHYKWRLMRAHGLPEDVVTGNAPDYDKFRAWCSVMPYCAGNPLYTWAHMELRRYFGFDKVLSPETCDEAWEATRERLRDRSMNAVGIVEQSNVRFLCTTDDPADSLTHHKSIRNGSPIGFKVLPTFRPDAAINIDKPGFAAYIVCLGAAAGARINSFDSLFDALNRRIDFFHSMGCLCADHGFEAVPFLRQTPSLRADAIFIKALAGGTVSIEEAQVYKTELFLRLAAAYKARKWALQIHFGPSRNNSSRLMSLLGPDVGGDAIGGQSNILPMTRLLDALDRDGNLPKTILYSLNPADNTALDALIGSFPFDGVPCKIQHGSAWWFSDNARGIRDHLTSLAANSVLGHFVGMLTDSRSLLSYVRHEYFRRVLCDVVGSFADSGVFPADLPLLGRLVEDVCYNNAVRYFGF